MRFFGGLSVEETAEVLKISPVTVMRDWSTAKAWLYRELTGGATGWTLSGGNKSTACCSRCWSARPDERDAFLRQACATDQALETEVRSLLKAQQQAGSFLESPAIEAAARAIAQQQNKT